MLNIPGIDIDIISAELLQKDSTLPVEFQSGNGSLGLEWPSHLNDDAVTVVRLEVAEGYKTDNTPRQHKDGGIEFNCWAMKIHGDQARPHYDGFGNRLRILDWTDPEEYLSAEFIMEQPGKYKVELIYSASNGIAGGRFQLRIGEQSFGDTIRFTSDSWDPAPIFISDVEIPEAGKYPMEIRPVNDGNWRGFQLQGIRLTPVKP
jgi:hypothetical protein